MASEGGIGYAAGLNWFAGLSADERAQLNRAAEAGEREADAAGGKQRPLPKAEPLLEIDDPFPKPLLSLAGKGAVLTQGKVCLLSGAGGVGKSALLASLAVDVAGAVSDPAAAGPLCWHGGKGGVLLATYEDRPGVWRQRCERYLLAAGKGARPEPAGRLAAVRAVERSRRLLQPASGGA